MHLESRESLTMCPQMRYILKRVLKISRIAENISRVHEPRPRNKLKISRERNARIYDIRHIFNEEGERNIIIKISYKRQKD